MARQVDVESGAGVVVFGGDRADVPFDELVDQIRADAGCVVGSADEWVEQLALQFGGDAGALVGDG